jgi:hypothetical protein
MLQISGRGACSYLFAHLAVAVYIEEGPFEVLLIAIINRGAPYSRHGSFIILALNANRAPSQSVRTEKGAPVRLKTADSKITN